MNPYYDLVVIGLIVFAVLVNLYYSSEYAQQASTLLSKLREKLTSSLPLGQKATVQRAPAYFSLD